MEKESIKNEIQYALSNGYLSPQTSRYLSNLIGNGKPTKKIKNG